MCTWAFGRRFPSIDMSLQSHSRMKVFNACFEDRASKELMTEDGVEVRDIVMSNVSLDFNAQLR